MIVYNVEEDYFTTFNMILLCQNYSVIKNILFYVFVSTPLRMQAEPLCLTGSASLSL